MSVFKWVLVVAVIIVMIAVWYVAQPKTTLDIEIAGGFAYVTPQPGSTDNHVEVAYLNSWTYKEDIDPATPGDEVVCDVQQIGTKLKLVTGSIVDFAPSTFPIPGNREFMLDKAVVTFPAVEAASQSLSINRNPPWPPTPAEPGNPDNDPEWEDLKWVPSLSEYHKTLTPAHSLDPNWRNIVNGRVVLRGGALKAGYPTNSRFRRGRLDFKRNGVSKVVAATDKTVYSITLPTRELPNGNLEILFSGASSGLTKLVIKPDNKVVAFTLNGIHNMGAPIPAPGAELKDFCTFYQLFQPPVKAAEYVRPYYVAAPPGPGGGGGAGSPGFFCPGDWF